MTTDEASTQELPGTVAESVGDTPPSPSTPTAPVAPVDGEFVKGKPLPPSAKLHRIDAPSCGRIVHVGSVLGRIATPMVGSYCASKFALEALARLDTQARLARVIAMTVMGDCLPKAPHKERQGQ